MPSRDSREPFLTESVCFRFFSKFVNFSATWSALAACVMKGKPEGKNLRVRMSQWMMQADVSFNHFLAA